MEKCGDYVEKTLDYKEIWTISAEATLTPGAFLLLPNVQQKNVHSDPTVETFKA